MLISEVSVRWTGHLLAISSSRTRCCSVSSPAIVISLSIRSSMPCAVSHSAQSSAWILEWRKRTVTPLTGHPFLRAYSAIVIDVQPPRAASSRSYGPSPRAVPPADTGSSGLRRRRPAGIPRAEQAAPVRRAGRRRDPERARDAKRNVGGRDGRIAAVTEEPLAARETLAVAGLVVAPGFIDLHAHGQDSESYRYYAHDGVTTALELEIGTFPVARWYAERDGRALINYGVTVGHPGARRALLRHDQSLTGAAALGDTSRTWTHGTLRDAELPRLDTLVDQGLAEGALGVGFGIAYTPGASRQEILHLFRVAARRGVVCFVHLREGGRDPESGGSVGALQEVLADATATGAALHVVHVTSMGQSDTPFLLQLIAGAREPRLDRTPEAYPYTAASTGIQSAVFDRGWQDRMGIGYRDIL